MVEIFFQFNQKRIMQNNTKKQSSDKIVLYE